ncbi:hypothetical protein WUBG_18396, partial [Wuchereria bancrofti]
MTVQWQSEAKRYQKWAEQWQQYQVAQSPNPQDPLVGQLISQNKELEEQLERGWQMYEQCQVNGTSISRQQEIEHYKCMTVQWQSEAKRYQKWAEQWQQYQVAQSPNPQDPL